MYYNGSDVYDVADFSTHWRSTLCLSEISGSPAALSLLLQSPGEQNKIWYLYIVLRERTFLDFTHLCFLGGANLILWKLGNFTLSTSLWGREWGGGGGY